MSISNRYPHSFPAPRAAAHADREHRRDGDQRWRSERAAAGGVCGGITLYGRQPPPTICSRVSSRFREGAGQDYRVNSIGDH